MIEFDELIQKKKDIGDKWRETGLLHGLEQWEECDAAVLLENQHLYNKGPCLYNEGNFETQFKMLSIPLVRRIWGGLVSRKIFSIQPQFGKDGSFYCADRDDVLLRQNKIELRDFINTKAVFQPTNFHSLDVIAEMTAVLAQEMTLHIDRQGLREVADNAATKATWNFDDALGDTIKEKYEGLYVKLVETCNTVAKNYGVLPNWIVTSPEIASLFELSSSAALFVGGICIEHIMNINNRWKLYKDPMFPPGEMLLGYKGDEPYDSGYFFCPQVLANLVDVDSVKTLGFSAAAKLVHPEYYAVLNVLNFVI